MWRLQGLYCLGSVCGLEVCGVHNVCNVSEAVSLVFLFLFIYFYFFLWCGVRGSVYGALRWDPCGVHSICSVYQAFGLVIFCPFRVSAAVRGHWGGTLVAFTVLVVFYWALGLDICGTFQRL